MIKRADANGNGTIEPEEAQQNGMVRFMLDRMARDENLDLSRPISVSRLEEIAKKRAEQRAREGGGFGGSRSFGSSSEKSPDGYRLSSGGSSDASIASNFPTFGLAGDALALVPGFGADADAELERTVLNKNYDRRVVEDVDEMLERYDRDKSGALEREEWSTARWSSDPAESDTNHDGILNRAELLERTARRRGYLSSSSPSTKPGTAAAAPGNDSKLNGYAETMIRQYDENRDGILQKDEWSKMRGDPAAADTNRDSVLSRDEVAAWLGARYGVTTGTTSSKTSKDGNTPGVYVNPAKSYKMKTATERLPKNLPPWFARSDANGDGQILMHEYTSLWSEAKAQEFAQFDTNGDGVITPQECLAQKSLTPK